MIGQSPVADGQVSPQDQGREADPDGYGDAAGPLTTTRVGREATWQL